ncbi:MAG: acyl carrier protein [Bacteroidales bacterium]
MENEDIITAVTGLLIREFETDEKEIHPGASLKDDPGLVSLDFADIAVMVKKKFGINVRGKESSL